MRVVIIDEGRLRRLRAFAESHPLDLAEVRRIVAGQAPPAGDREGYAIVLDSGLRVVSSIEEMPRADGTGGIRLRRLSLSVDRPGHFPHPAAVEQIARALGFPRMEECRLDVDTGGHAALVEAPYDPPPRSG